MEQIEKRFFTVKEIAKLFCMSEGTVYNQLSRNSKKGFPIKPKRIGRTVRFDIRDVNTYLDSI